MLAALFSHAVSTMMALPASKAAEVHTELPEEQVGSRVGEMWCAAPPIKVALPSFQTTSQQPTGSRRKPVYTSCTTCHLSQREAVWRTRVGRSMRYDGSARCGECADKDAAEGVKQLLAVIGVARGVELFVHCARS